MLKFYAMFTSRLKMTVFATTMCLPLAGCLNAADPWGEGSMAYTADEMYPIGGNKPCGQNWTDLGNDESNHFSPNHGCAVHANITAMIADPTVIKKPKRRPRIVDATTATAAINNLLVNASESTKTTNGVGSAP
jgi:hypothetical protein